jgi:putative endonuclease
MQQQISPLRRQNAPPSVEMTWFGLEQRGGEEGKIGMTRNVEKMFYVYLDADRSRVLYVGFTSDLRGRVIQHREGWFEGFTKSYACHRLVWFERFTTASAGIAREKQIKRWRREKKIALIERDNPTWEDLSLQWEGAVELYQWPEK